MLPAVSSPCNMLLTMSLLLLFQHTFLTQAAPASLNYLPGLETNLPIHGRFNYSRSEQVLRLGLVNLKLILQLS